MFEIGEFLETYIQSQEIKSNNKRETEVYRISKYHLEYSFLLYFSIRVKRFFFVYKVQISIL